MTINIILLNPEQLIWVENKNNTSEFNAIVCDYTDINDVDYNNCITADVLTLEGYEDWATYFNGATITEVEIKTPF